MVALGQVCLYASGEESPTQVALRAQRLGVNTKGLKFISEIQLEKIEAIIEETSPQWVVIDSIQTLFSEDLSAAPGSVSQVKECAARLTRIAKRKGHRRYLRRTRHKRGRYGWPSRLGTHG